MYDPQKAHDSRRTPQVAKPPPSYDSMSREEIDAAIRDLYDPDSLDDRTDELLDEIIKEQSSGG